MDVLTPFFKARFISNLITFFIIWNYAESQLKNTMHKSINLMKNK